MGRSLLDLDHDTLKVLCAAVFLEARRKAEDGVFEIAGYPFDAVFWSYVELFERGILRLNFDSRREVFWVEVADASGWVDGTPDIEMLKLRIGPIYREIRHNAGVA